MHTVESAAPVVEQDIPLPIPDTDALAAVARDARLSAAERAHLRIALWLLLSGARRAGAALDRVAHQRRIDLARAAEVRARLELQRALLRRAD